MADNVITEKKQSSEKLLSALLKEQKLQEQINRTSRDSYNLIIKQNKAYLNRTVELEKTKAAIYKLNNELKTSNQNQSTQAAIQVKINSLVKKQTTLLSEINDIEKRTTDENYHKLQQIENINSELDTMKDTSSYIAKSSASYASKQKSILAVATHEGRLLKAKQKIESLALNKKVQSARLTKEAFKELKKVTIESQKQNDIEKDFGNIRDNIESNPYGDYYQDMQKPLLKVSAYADLLSEKFEGLSPILGRLSAKFKDVGFITKASAIATKSAMLMSGASFFNNINTSVQNYNKEILDTGIFAGVSADKISSGFNKTNDVISNLKGNFSSAFDSEKIAINREEIIDITKSLKDAGIAVNKLKSSYSSSNGVLQENGDAALELAKKIKITAASWGVSTSEMAKMFGDAFSDFGITGKTAEETFAALRDAAGKSQMSTNAFSNIVMGAVGTLGVYSSSVEDVTSYVEALGKSGLLTTKQIAGIASSFEKVDTKELTKTLAMLDPKQKSILKKGTQETIDSSTKKRDKLLSEKNRTPEQQIELNRLNLEITNLTKGINALDKGNLLEASSYLKNSSKFVMQAALSQAKSLSDMGKRRDASEEMLSKFIKSPELIQAALDEVYSGGKMILPEEVSTTKDKAALAKEQETAGKAAINASENKGNKIITAMADWAKSLPGVSTASFVASGALAVLSTTALLASGSLALLSPLGKGLTNLLKKLIPIGATAGGSRGVAGNLPKVYTRKGVGNIKSEKIAGGKPPETQLDLFNNKTPTTKPDYGRKVPKAQGVATSVSKSTNAQTLLKGASRFTKVIKGGLQGLALGASFEVGQKIGSLVNDLDEVVGERLGKEQGYIASNVQDTLSWGTKKLGGRGVISEEDAFKLAEEKFASQKAKLQPPKVDPLSKVGSAPNKDSKEFSPKNVTMTNNFSLRVDTKETALLVRNLINEELKKGVRV